MDCQLTDAEAKEKESSRAGVLEEAQDFLRLTLLGRDQPRPDMQAIPKHEHDVSGHNESIRSDMEKHSNSNTLGSGAQSSILTKG